MQTLYDVLGVPMSATQAQIDKAHRTLLLRVHPDRCYTDNDSSIFNPDDELDEARLKVLEKAYAVLADPAQRRLYDNYLVQKQRSAVAVMPSIFASPLEWLAGADPAAAAGDDMLRSMMGLLSISLARPKPSLAATAAGAPPTQQQQQQQLPAETVARGGPTVYAASVRVQRLPDGSIEVETSKTGELPRRVRVMQEQLAARGVPSASKTSGDMDNAVDALTSSVVSLTSAVTAETQ